MRQLIVRTVSGAFYVAIMVVGVMRPLSLAFLFALITAMAIWEFCGLVNGREEVCVNRFICSAAGVFLSLAFFGFCSGLTSALVFIPYMLTLIYLLISELYLKQPDPLHDWAYSMMSQLYIALPLSTIHILAFSFGEYRFILPLGVFVFLWCNDTGAYMVGSLLGRHKLFPRISPSKSWEGSVGGAVLVLVVAAIISLLERPLSGLSLVDWLGLGLVVVFFGTWGDLVESLMKRTLHIKDSGNMMPGHGGILDRFDSSLMAIPAAVIYIYTLFII